MKQFPDAITPPTYVSKIRAERESHLRRTIIIGASVRSFIILGELIGVAFTESSSLLMDAISSLIDVFSSIILFLFIKLAGRPPDEDHPFGHGRYEPLAGLQLGLLLVIFGIMMLIQQSWKLGVSHQGELYPLTWIFPFFALVLLEICYSIAMRTAKKHNSPALAADAMHYRIDSLTSLFATVALLFAAYFPDWSLTIDHMGAIAISLLMIGFGLYATKSNLNQLMDKIPSARYFEQVRRAAKSVPGVEDTEKLRIQIYGPDAHVDIDIEVDPNLSVAKAHEISQKVRAHIQKDWPLVRDVTVHIEPYYPGDH